MVHLEAAVEQDTPKLWSLAINEHVVLLLHLVCIRLITLCVLKLVYPTPHDLLASHTALLTSIFPFWQFQLTVAFKHAESWSTELFQKHYNVCVLKERNHITVFLINRTPIVRKHSFYSNGISVIVWTISIAVVTVNSYF